MRHVMRLTATALLAGTLTLLLAPAAYADNCDIFINPLDCANTAWTTGSAGLLAAILAILAAAAAGTAQPNSQQDEKQDEACKVATVRIWFKAFLPKEIPGYTWVAPGPLGLTMIQASMFHPPSRDPALTNTAMLTDQRDFSPDPAATTRMHSEMTIDVATAVMTHEFHHGGEAVLVEAATGRQTCRQVGDNGRMRFANFQALSANSFNTDLQATVSNPCSTLFPDVAYQGTITVVITEQQVEQKSLQHAIVAFMGTVQSFPAFEMYASVNGGPGHPVFAAPPAADKPAGQVAISSRPVQGKVTIDCHGNAASAATPGPPQSHHAPRPVDQAVMPVVIGAGADTIQTGTVLGELRPWDIVLDSSGNERLIAAVYSGEVYFVSNNRTWVQTKHGFTQDVVYAPIAMAGRQLAPVRRLLELQAAFALGVLTVVSLPAFLAVNGLALVIFIANHRDTDFSRWHDGLRLLVRAHQALKQYAPTLYGAMFRTAMRELWEKLPDHIAETDIAKFLGQLFGTISGAKFRSVFQIAVLVIKILNQALTPVVKAAIRAGKNITRDVGASIEQVRTGFRQQGVELGAQEALQIITEYAGSEELIKAALEDLQRGLQQLEH